MLALSASISGAIGGFLADAHLNSTRILAWNKDRHTAMGKGRHRGHAGWPSLRSYFDPASDGAALLTRIVMGAGAAWLMHAQIVSPYAATIIGWSAPTVLLRISTLIDPKKSAFPPVIAGDSIITGLTPHEQDVAEEVEH